MSWIIFTLIAMGLWLLVNLLDKYIISHELKDAKLVTTIFGLAIYIFFVIFALLSNGSIVVPLNIIVAAVIAGIIYSFATYFYYALMKEEEVSCFVPMLATEPLIIAIASYFLFNENLAFKNYLGILIIVMGAIIISYRKAAFKIKNRIIWLHVLSALVLFSARNLLFEYATAIVSLWSFMLWFGIGGLIIPIIMIIRHHPHFRKKAEHEGFLHLLLVAFISAIALIFFIKAISVGSVSLVIALVSAKPLLLLISVILLSYYNPKFICEAHTRKVITKKIIATVLIVAGCLLII